MFQRIGIYASRIDKNVTLAAQEILEWGKIHEIQIFLGNRLFKSLNGKNIKKGLETCEVIVILGGDGTTLQAARQFPTIPLLVINFGKVGFLSSHNYDKIDTALDELRKDLLHITEYDRLG